MCGYLFFQIQGVGSENNLSWEVPVTVPPFCLFFFMGLFDILIANQSLQD